MHFDVAHGILEDSELEVYKRRYDEFCTPNPLYCPIPTCSTFIPPRHLNPIHDKVNCPRCTALICIKCKQAADEVHICKRDESRKQILKNFDYKLCPSKYPDQAWAALLPPLVRS